MTIAVTAATGQLGRLAVNELLRTQPAASVVAVVRNAEKAAPLAALGVDVRVASYDDPVALKSALAGVERLLLISGSEVGQRRTQHRNVIDAAVDNGVGFLVYTSVTNALRSDLVLAPEHRATEEYLASVSVPSAVVRNNWYTENYVSQFEPVRATGTLVAAAGDGLVASASRADYAAGAVAVLLGDIDDGAVHEFGGDHAWHHDELAAALAEVLDRPVTYQPVDSEQLVAGLREHGLDDATAGFVAALDEGIAAGLLAGPTGHLSEVIGRPTTPLVDALRSTLP